MDGDPRPINGDGSISPSRSGVSRSAQHATDVTAPGDAIGRRSSPRPCRSANNVPRRPATNAGRPVPTNNMRAPGRWAPSRAIAAGWMPASAYPLLGGREGTDISHCRSLKDEAEHDPRGCPRSEPDERDDTSRACSCRWKPRTASRHEREATLNDGGGRDHCKNPKRPRSGSVDEGFHSERGPMARAGRRRDSVRGGRPDGARARRQPHAHERRRHSAAEILRARAVISLHFEG
jgi:hypothetical protein